VKIASQTGKKGVCHKFQFYPNVINLGGHIPFDYDLTTFPGKLKAYRYIKGFSQKRLGKILEVDDATVCSWKIGELQPNKRALKK